MSQMTELDPVVQEIRAAQRELGKHKTFAELTDLERLHLFMETHVYAVWDFMTLLKRLQLDLTCYKTPWTNPPDFVVARLINEIVLGEETDLLADGTPMSHFSMYLAGMEEVGANTGPIREFVNKVHNGVDIETALDTTPGIPEGGKAFVRKTMTVALGDDITEIAAWFLFGRESVIPVMFRGLLDNWGIARKDTPLFTFYLDRHIRLDETEHAPAAFRMLAVLLERDGKTIEDVRAASLAALDARTQLWNSVYDQIKAGQ